MRVERVLQDRSNVYPNGIVGPSEADTREFRPRKRRGWIAEGKYQSSADLFVANLMGSVINPKITTIDIAPSEDLSRILKRNRRLRPAPALAGLTAAVGFLAAACGPIKSEASADGSTPQPSPETGVLGAREAQPPEDPNGLVLPFARGETWYLLQGNHANSIDIGAKEIIHCKEDGKINGKRIEPYPAPPNEWVTASQSGKVLVVGNEEDRSDRNHSLVQIKGNDGTLINYVHLDNIKVKKDQNVLASQELGQPSCEFPPDGDTTGIHVHLTVVGGINNKTFSGWTVQGDRMISSVGTKRVADGGRCGEGSNCVKNGDIFRNDLIRGPIGTITGGVGGVSGPGTTEIPFVSQPPESNLSVVEQIDQFFAELGYNAPEEQIDQQALKVWLQYLNSLQTPEYRHDQIYETKILNFDEFKSQIPFVLKDRGLTTPLKVSIVYKNTSYNGNGLQKLMIQVEIPDIKINRDTAYNNGRGLMYRLRFQGIDYRVVGNVDPNKTKGWLEEGPDRPFPEWSDLFWGVSYATVYESTNGSGDFSKPEFSDGNPKGPQRRIILPLTFNPKGEINYFTNPARYPIEPNSFGDAAQALGAFEIVNLDPQSI